MPADTKTAATPAPVAFPLSVHEFCAELSAKDKRPEMIYAFSKDEERNGRQRDLAASYQTRFEAFCGRPL